MFTEFGNVSFNDKSIIDPLRVFNSLDECLREYRARYPKSAATILRINDAAYVRMSCCSPVLETLTFEPAVCADESVEIAALSSKARALIAIEDEALDALRKREIFPLRGMFHSISRQISSSESDADSIESAKHWEGEKARTYFSLIEKRHQSIMSEIEKR